MANLIKWSALGSAVTTINGDATTPTLKNLANNGQKIGNEVDNTSGRDQYAIWELKARGASAFSAGAYAELYFIEAFDGSTYQDGDDSVAPPASALAGVFPLRGVSTQQIVALPPIPLPPCKFKALIINKGGQAFTNTDSENVLRYRIANDEVQ